MSDNLSNYFNLNYLCHIQHLQHQVMNTASYRLTNYAGRN